MTFQGFRDLLETMEGIRPNKTAFVYGDEPSTCTWKEFGELVRAREAQLVEEGHSCEAIFCDGSLECVVEIFAAVMAGMQIAMLDISIPLPGIPELVKAVDADSVWGDEARQKAAADALVKNAPAIANEDKVLGPVSRILGPTAGNVLFFTSGTTARSKAVVTTDVRIMSSVGGGAAVMPLEEDDTLLGLLPLAHVFGLACGLLWGLSCGATVALGRGMRHYVDDCKHFKPTAISLVPSLLAFMLRGNVFNEELKLVLIGAGDCHPDLVNALKAQGRRVTFGYGLTETSSGLALSLTDDTYAMDVCPGISFSFEEDGEILVDAPGSVMCGYYKQPDATSEVLIDGILHTGDLGKLDENGRLHVIGRKKDVLVLNNGTKIFLPEYERDVAAAIGQRDMAVTLRRGKPVLVMNGFNETVAQLRKSLEDTMAKLPSSQRLSGIVEFGRELPRTASGKVKRWEVTAELERRWKEARENRGKKSKDEDIEIVEAPADDE